MATTPISGYAGPLSRVDWVSRYFALHEGYFRLSWRVIPIFLALIAVAVILAVMGPPIQHLNWIIGVALQIGALPFLLMPGNFVATWMFGYIAGQPGGEKGFDIKDGTEKGAEYVKKFGRSIGYVLFFGALPFMALGLFDIRPNPIGAVIVLALSVSLTIGGLMLFQDAKWFMGFVWTIYLVITLWILAGFIPGLREIQNNFVQTANHFIATRLANSQSDKAKKAAEAAIHNERDTQAVQCYKNALIKSTLEAKTAAKAECDKLHAAVNEPLFQGMGSASGAKSSATASTAAGAVNAAGNTAAATSSQVGKRVEYAPSQVTGAISLGDYAAGNYRIIGEGKRTQRFGSANWEMDAYGRVTAEGGNTYSAPSSAPIAGPNGMVIARSGGKTYKVDTCFRHPGGRIHGDLNVAPGDYVGSGSITIWVEKC